MPSGVLYSPVRSPLHRVNPLTKLAGLLWLASLVVVSPTTMVWALCGVLLAASVAIGLGRPVLARFAATALPFVVAVTLVQTLAVSHPDARPLLGLLSYSPSGFARAAAVGGRVATIIAASLAIFASMHPSTLLRALDGAGWPPALSYLLASPLLTMDSFGARAHAIRDVQATRGLQLKGRWVAGLRSLPALAAPLITSALLEADERGRVLAGRGFGAYPKRTTLDPVPDAPWERPLRYALAALTALQIASAFWR